MCAVEKRPKVTEASSAGGYSEVKISVAAATESRHPVREKRSPALGRTGRCAAPISNATPARSKTQIGNGNVVPSVVATASPNRATAWHHMASRTRALDLRTASVSITPVPACQNQLLYSAIDRILHPLAITVGLSAPIALKG